jgi:hypothetical protein
MGINGKPTLLMSSIIAIIVTAPLAPRRTQNEKLEIGPQTSNIKLRKIESTLKETSKQLRPDHDEFQSK